MPTNAVRAVATPATVHAAAKLAAVTEISGRLNRSMYAVTQVELRRYKRLERLLPQLQADQKMLEAKIQAALDCGAPIQEGKLRAVIETAPARANVSWKDAYVDIAGEAAAEAKLAEARTEARSKPGTPKVRVFPVAPQGVD